jgi:hypothetical protein
LLELLGAQLDPTAPDLDQRLLEPCERLELLEREPLIAQRHLPIEVHERLLAEGRGSRGPARRGTATPQPDVDPQAALQPRHEHAHPIGAQEERLLAHELMGLAGR